MAKSKSRKSVLSIPVMKLKVTLLRIEPPIWRRILAPSSMRLGDFHYLLQDATGWTNSHLHRFVVAGVPYSDPAIDDEGGFEDEHDLTLAKALPKVGARIVYDYDYGDNWEHEIELEEILARTPDMVVPSCLDGRRSRPPEDCGGPHGYEDILAILANPQHEEYAERKEWLGDRFDPEAFDLADIDKAIKTNRTRKLTEKAMREMYGP